MCTESRCCCLKLETGTLIFGIFASVLNGILILIIIGLTIAFNVIGVMQIRPNGYEVSDNGATIVYHGFDPRPMIFINMGLILALLKTIMDFTFTVLLCNGVTKRNPSNIKAYFIYGVVMAVLASMVMVGIVVELGNLIGALVFTVILILYSLILHMINLTHHKISTSAVYGFEHKRLAETVY